MGIDILYLPEPNRSLNISHPIEQVRDYIAKANIVGLCWARAELYGKSNEKEVVVGFTNCIYFKSEATD